MWTAPPKGQEWKTKQTSVLLTELLQRGDLTRGNAAVDWYRYRYPNPWPIPVDHGCAWRTEARVPVDVALERASHTADSVLHDVHADVISHGRVARMAGALPRLRL
jgi:hypothetical protein